MKWLKSRTVWTMIGMGALNVIQLVPQSPLHVDPHTLNWINFGGTVLGTIFRANPRVQ